MREEAKISVVACTYVRDRKHKTRAGGEETITTVDYTLPVLCRTSKTELSESRHGPTFRGAFDILAKRKRAAAAYTRGTYLPTCYERAIRRPRAYRKASDICLLPMCAAKAHRTATDTYNVIQYS